MENILLVEPNYKNKYPPIGLMKISTYYKQKGDHVRFCKGLMPSVEIKEYDKVFITTLFTFDFAITKDTIAYYVSILGADKVFVGGISATIMENRYKELIPDIQIVTGQLTSSDILGYKDNVNIDLLNLDYDILFDINYKYPSADSYFIHTTRGCCRKCDFCAVKTLEPNFYDCNNIAEQIHSVDRNFGIKKNLLIMDNNILFSNNLEDTVDALEDLGFGKNNSWIKKDNPTNYYLTSLEGRIDNNTPLKPLLETISEMLFNLNNKRIRSELKLGLDDLTTFLSDSSHTLMEKAGYLIERREEIILLFETYSRNPIKRFVDFNQGLDARLFTKEKAAMLARLEIKPCRIAFDDLETQKDYFSSLMLCINSGILYFSNYLLYNFKEKPADLWKRLSLNIEFCKKNPNVKLFSFPMKYANIEDIDRKYIGKHWNSKYLKAMNIILNVWKGVVPQEDALFYRAFGENSRAFLQILSMPDDFIRYRTFFESNGLMEIWRTQFLDLSYAQKKKLLKIVGKNLNEISSLKKSKSAVVNNMMKFYLIKKALIGDKNLVTSQEILDFYEIES